MASFKNWSGNVKSQPSLYGFPKNEQEIIEIITKHNNIRTIGSGHSFTRLCETDGALISLDNYKGLINVDKEKMEVTVKAGTKISEFGQMAFKHGVAQENLGDIDKQSLAGAISTGTHGTGISFKNIPSQLTAIKFINGKGEIVYCSETENPELFKAAQISLGSFGIITELTFKVVDSYKLEFYSGKDTVEGVLNKLDQINQDTRNFEFYWFPHTDTVQTKFSNIGQGEAKDNKFGNWMDNFLENSVFGAMSDATARMKGLSPTIAKISGLVAGTSKKLNWSHKVYTLERDVRFNEMEYNVPYEVYPEVIREVVRTFKKNKWDIHFPLENRFSAGDDIWLSPAYGRKSAYIAFHVYYKKPYKEYFKVMEDICRSYDGRPHWGKLHTLTASTLSQIYPKWEDFNKVRKEQDPEGKFLTPYLRELLGD